ncbi:hypothetical protein BN77_4217 [Rhizobium mesoamericanum STM3625]|uniref:Uncharacterized protein n=1 Tax=Rhizobium mesoamericanum STM3625 TaxID=1211777 RepID=K0PZD9_9HYPH|nr:hypothetical protein BN77_4217 [Rhizobium mesoamericanum STM3625]
MPSVSQPEEEFGRASALKMGPPSGIGAVGHRPADQGGRASIEHCCHVKAPAIRAVGGPLASELAAATFPTKPERLVEPHVPSYFSPDAPFVYRLGQQILIL